MSESRKDAAHFFALVVDGVTESPHEDPDGMDLTVDQLISSLGHCQIAAIVRANGMTLATNNVAEFGRVSGLLVEDWEQGD